CPQKSVEFLLEVGRKIGCRPILIPTTDEAATFAADHAGPLSERYLFPDQKPQLVHALSSKKEMYHLAKKFGVPTAETLFPESRADVLRFAPDVRFPVMLKGIYGKKLKQRAGKPMFIARNQTELLEL